VAFAGGLFPVQPAEKVKGGWNVNGLWKFASGSKGADVLGVGIGVGEGGKPLTAVLKPEDVEIIENWEVIGMRGTGSHDLKVTNVFVPDEWTFIRGGKPSIEEPIYQYPSIAYAAQVLAVVNLGIARTAIDELAQVAGSRPSITGAPRLADRAYLRISLAKAEATLRSARAFFYEATDAAWESIQKGDGVSREQTSTLRLAAAQAAREGAKAVQEAYLLSGTAAIYDGHPMQRHLRDAMVVTQHAFLNESMYEGAGSVMLDVEPIRGFI
jgi:alkylation response protein AidB-like acyl-CoA dehydrogenase